MSSRASRVIAGDLSAEKDKYRLISIDVEAAFAELNGF